MLNATLKNLPRSRTLYKHPDYLLDQYDYKQFIDNSIREFLVIHSNMAEEYYHAPETHIKDTAPLVKSYYDISTKVIERKLENLLRNVDDEPSKPQITTINELMDDIVDSIDNPTTVFMALMKHIEAAACKYRKRTVTIIDKIRSKELEIKSLKQEGKILDTSIQLQLVTQQLQDLNAILLAKQKTNFADKTNTLADKPTKFFLNRGKKKGGRFNIHKIKTNQQTLTGDQATTHMEKKFKALLGSESIIQDSKTVSDFLLETEIHSKKLSQSQADHMDREITIGELDEVVNDSHTDSAPGMSGISYAQIKELWRLIRRLFYRVTKECLDQCFKTRDELSYIYRRQWAVQYNLRRVY
jgi:hypothetical protein